LKVEGGSGKEEMMMMMDAVTLIVTVHGFQEVNHDDTSLSIKKNRTRRDAD